MSMKPDACLFALLAACAGAASAESSLTIFGRVDLSVRYLKNADARQTQVAPDGTTPSRLGFRGIEDIADGLRAGFHLESSVAADTGNFSANGKFWNRRSTVSLYTRYGELRVGRDVVPTWVPFVECDVFSVSGIGDGSRTYRPLGGADTRVLSDNMVSYLLPGNPWGIYGMISSAPSEGLAGRRYAGARLGYRKGPVDFSVAYSKTSVETGTYKLAIASGSYDFGWAKFYGLVQKTELLEQVNLHGDLGVAVPVFGGTFRASYVRVDGQGALEAADAEQYALGFVYDLSKRTALYTTVAMLDNKGTADYAVGNITVAAPANAAVALPLPPGTKSQGAEAGIRHIV